MKTTHIFKAQSIIKGEPIDSQLISIETTIPDEMTLDGARTVFAEEAKMLADALFSCLPGGTLDVLLIEMLERKRSLFVINPYIQPRGKNDERS